MQVDCCFAIIEKWFITFALRSLVVGAFSSSLLILPSPLELKSCLLCIRWLLNPRVCKHRSLLHCVLAFPLYFNPCFIDKRAGGTRSLSLSSLLFLTLKAAAAAAAATTATSCCPLAESSTTAPISCLAPNS